MEDEQENKLSMYRATELFLDDNDTIWNGIPAIVATKTAFSNKIVAIQAAAQQQDVIITGISTDKKVLKATLVDIAYPVTSALIAFASQNNNNELLEAVNYTRSDLLRTKDDLIGQRCQNIHDFANSNLAALLPFGITAAVLTTLQNAINSYSAKAPQPRTAIVGKSAVTVTLKNLFKETDTILKLQLDKLIVQLKATQPDFYNGYLGAREIINLGTTSAKVRGQVLRQDNAFLPGVSFSIYQTGTDTLVKQVFTNQEGKFNASQLPAGDFDFKWELAGYFTITETNVHIGPGKELKRQKTMKEGGFSQTIPGDVPAGAISNIIINLQHPIVDETTIRLSVTGSALRFYAATGNMDPPGAVYLDVLAGQVIQKPIDEFITLLGFEGGELQDFLNVQNNSATPGHYALKFENLGG